jgi:hypothetical protein
MTEHTPSSASRGYYNRILAAERVGAELIRELEIRAPEFMLRKALESRGSTLGAILSDWIQQQADLPGVMTYPPEEHAKSELRRRLKARLTECFPERCNY